VTLVSRGQRPPRQDEPPLSDGAWELIQQCWVMEPLKRPRMKDVAKQMNRALIPDAELSGEAIEASKEVRQMFSEKEAKRQA
jgi:hypothetical protein